MNGVYNVTMEVQKGTALYVILQSNTREIIVPPDFHVSGLCKSFLQCDQVHVKTALILTFISQLYMLSQGN